MNIKIFSRDQEDEYITPHFKAKEFFCKCGKCENQLIDLDHVKRLEDLRNIFAATIHVNCGYRCEPHNGEINPNEAFTTKQHPKGCATDITAKDLPALKKAIDLCNFNGVGEYTTFYHVDSRTGGKARWRG